MSTSNGLTKSAVNGRSGTFAAAAIFAALFAMVTVLAACASGHSSNANGADSLPIPASMAPSDGSFVLDVTELLRSLDGASAKDADDQYRDWAVYGALTHLGYAADTIAKATLTMAPMRLAYLDDVARYDYGRGRRAIVDRGEVLFFVDRSDPDPVATVGRLADRVRMETGAIPASARVYRIAPEPSQGIIRIQPLAPVAASDLFGPAYGYVERVVRTPDDLAWWLGATDDVTYTRVDGDSVVLGGRRFPRSRTRSLELDDVAALYQAHTEIHAFQAMMATLWGRDGSQQLLDGLAPGFSLDPQWRLDDAAADLRRMAHDPCEFARGVGFAATQPADHVPTALESARARVSEALRDDPDPKSTCAAVARTYRTDIANLIDATAARSDVFGQRFNAWVAHLSTDTRVESLLAYELIRLIDRKDQVQCARYEPDARLQRPDAGPIQGLAGTRVGMNLFYTDLLTKLWIGVDYDHLAPAARVPGFLSLPRMNLESAWNADADRNRFTRLWFGPRPGSYTFDANSTTVVFQHTGTRLFAAGSDGMGDVEGQPSEDKRRAIGWADRHYDDISDYEPEYAVQNQIMKWSIITGWLERKGALGRINSVPVRHGERFDRWYAAHRGSLRFQRDVSVLAPAQSVDKTECIPLIESYAFTSGGEAQTIIGGVGLAGKRDIELAPRVSARSEPSLRWLDGLGDAARRADAERLPGSPPSGTGTALGSRISYRGPGEVLMARPEAVRARSGPVDASGAIGRSVTVKAEGVGNVSVKVRGEHASIGEFTATHGAPDTTRLGWTPGAGDDAVHVAAGKAPSDDEAIDLPSGKVLLDPDGAGVFHSAATGELRSLSPVDMQSEFDRHAWQTISFPTERARSARPRYSFGNYPPTSRARRVIVTDVPGTSRPLTLHIGEEGHIYVARPTHLPDRRPWADLHHSPGWTPDVFAKLRGHAGAGETTVAYSSLTAPPRASAPFDAVAVALQTGNRNGLLKAYRELPPSNTPDDRALRALCDITFGAVERGARELTDVAPYITPRMRGVAEGALARQRMSLDEIISGRSLDPRYPDGKMIVDGTKLVRARALGTPPGTLLTMADQRSVSATHGWRGKPVAVYIDDHMSASNVDAQASGEGMIAELAAEQPPGVSWTSVETSGAAWAPQVIEVNKTRYRRVDQQRASAATPRTFVLISNRGARASAPPQQADAGAP